MLARKLFRTAWGYKAQFISMVLMVTIGVGIFVGFNIEWKSIEADTGRFFEETKYADFRLYSEAGFKKSEIEALQAAEGIDAATRFLSVNVGIKDTEKTLSLNVCEEYNVSTMIVTAGAAYDPEGDGMWLSDKFAEANGIALGDTITMTYRAFSIAAEVVGLAKSGEHMICTPDDTQLMPDYESFGFAYITPAKLKSILPVDFYPQVNIRSGLAKAELEELVKDVLGRTIMVVPKEDHVAYAGAQSEADEGKAFGNILPVLFLAIGLLAMITTMHRITANEKTQIGTLKALGFKDRRILLHYTSYGFVIGLVGTILGVALGYGLARMIISPSGMMSTYFDLPRWDLVMPDFCYAALVAAVALITLIGYFSVRKMLSGTPAEALRPYVPKKMRRTLLERTRLWAGMSFGTRWNLRDILRHKSRSAMTLIGVVGCMLLLVGGLGMKDTMDGFMKVLEDDISNYATQISLAENTSKQDALALAEELEGDWGAVSGISLDGKTVMLEIYDVPRGKYRFVNEDNELVSLGDEGAYICLRLAETIRVGDEIEFSPYGGSETYRVKVAGVLRSLMTENVVMSRACAEANGIPYTITNIYTDLPADAIADSNLIASKQSKVIVMDSYDSFMEIMNYMVTLLVLGAVVLGVVVLYNLGVMSYIERYRELATLKVLGFKDRHIGRLLISQNVWLTVLGVVIGLPAGVVVLKALLAMLASEYELRLTLGALTYAVSIVVTFGVSLAVGVIVARKNRKIDMVEALKGAE